MITNAAAQTAASSGNGLHDIRPPVDIPSIWPSIFSGAGVLLAAAIAVIVWALLRRIQAQPPVYPAVPAHVRARQKLEEALALVSDPKAFCTLVSDTIRFYLEERFDFHAPERTTEEFLYELRDTQLLLPDQKESLGEFLKRCDLVKFARYEPREPELRDLHQSALRLIEETEPPPLPTEEVSNPESGVAPPVAA